MIDKAAREAWLKEYLRRTYPEDNVDKDEVCMNPGKEKDIDLFDVMQERERAIFIERRGQYGNHLVNAKRFPMEDKCGLYLKCARAIRDIEAGIEIKPDTLIDLSVYAKLIQSAREDKCTGG